MKLPHPLTLQSVGSAALLALTMSAFQAHALTPFTNVTQISTGNNHVCALTTTGQVKCWGIREGSSSSTVTLPATVSGLSEGAVSVSAGKVHSCAVTTAGGAKCWGGNSNGEVGKGTMSSSSATTVVTGLASGVAAVAAGGNHACALTTGGAVKCWGLNSAGQLGDGTNTTRTTPVDVVGLGSGVSAIAAGSNYTCALTMGGGLKCWGGNAAGQLGDSTTTPRTTPVDVTGLTSGVAAIALSSYSSTSCALTTVGGMKCWGSSLWGDVGDNSQLTRLSPVDVSGLTSGVVAISTSCAVLTGGALKCWGDNTYGQVGNGVVGAVHKLPVDVVGLSSGVTAVAKGGKMACAITAGGLAQCWGDNIEGELGDYTRRDNFPPGVSTPTDVPGMGSGIAAIRSAGSFFSCALTTTGGVKCIGHNNFGQLGDGTRMQRLSAVDVSGLASGVTSLAVGTAHACAVTAEGGAKCWGHGLDGKLGNNAATDQYSPVDVSGLSSGVAAVTAGSSHSCALTTSGGVKCWGGNSTGQLGDNSTTPRLVPVDVAGLTSGVAAIAAASSHTCALTTSGGVKCWGHNGTGKLGDNTQTTRLTPVDVQGLSGGVLGIAVSLDTSCAIATGGGVKCWGQHFDNTFDQYKLTPVDVPGFGTGVVSLSLSQNHGCAFNGSGAAKCWGSNQYGKIGLTGTSYATTPADVTSLSGVTDISAGGSFTCALTTGGAVKCFGYNLYGQFGLTDLGIRPYASAVLRTNATPNFFNFQSVTNAPLSSFVTSNTVTVAGNEEPAPIRGIGGTEYSIGCNGTFVSTPGFISAGQTLCVRMMTPATRGTQTLEGIVVGDQEFAASFMVTTVMYFLQLERSGTGSGTINIFTSSTCPSSCSWGVYHNQAFTLTAVPAQGSVFAGWTNCPSANGTVCTFVPSEPSTTVTARFDLPATRRADFNGDGRSEIVWFNTGTGMVYQMSVNGTSVTGGAVVDIADSADWRLVGSGDLNADGRADLVWYNSVTGELHGLLMNGTTISSEGRIHLEPNLDWKPEQIADLNGDGRADIVWKNQASGSVYVMLMNGLAQSGGQVVYTEPNLNWKIMASGDMNGDGRADLLWRNVATGDVFSMLMDGFTVLSGGVIYTEPNLNWKIIGLADFNNDGRADVLWQNTATGDVYEMQMNGTVVSAGQVIYNEPNTQWKIVALGDYNGDGRADILWQNSVNGAVYMMLMNGFAVSGADFVYTEPDTQWQIVGP